MTDAVEAIVWTVAWPKIVSYLLNPAHTDGASKAKYLLAFGYAAEEPERLAGDLVKHAVDHWPGRTVVRPIGLPRRVFEGPVTAPDGRVISLRSVWEITHDTEMRFLTAYPWKP
ncbi:DUF6883 domain-containing protein [Methylobacterium pseudosasicola]|uniref:DUF6883 domain-containing protein n=1 Tax=Methylobacterium pseudosasicola TaxID=582667 RepID=A0A1I4NE98_9HYPH|nr:DUF6883 domain-containing protein [Methylobacterium pseudosasicola]SFM13892.1 hypothetical protein SAMN05192568_102091 [Methylobacterium pseudosasicola]